jgi:predicted permease
VVFVTILSGLIPSFLMVCLGGLVRKRLSENAWQGLDRLNFEILFPALIFTAASSRGIALADVVRIAPAVWGLAVLGLAIGYLARRVGPDRFVDFAGAWQTAYRFNTAMGFVAVATLPNAPLGMLSVGVGMAIPMVNVFAVTALSRGSGSLSKTVIKVATNPFLVASLGGVVVGLSGVHIPDLIMTPVNLLAEAAIPVALLSIGATMNWRALAKLNRFSGILVSTKLLILPIAALVGSLVLHIDPMIAQMLVVFAALPPASAAHVLAAGFGADRELAATLVAEATLLAAVTLPVWVTIAAVTF